VTDKGLTVRPRFAPRELEVKVDPAVKVYTAETLDLDSIHAGDTLSFTGKVIGGDASAPTTLVLRTMTPADSEAPKVDEGDNDFFGGRSVTATVKGKITSLEPLKVQTEEGREVTIKVPGQIAYMRYRPAERSQLQAGQKALLAGRMQEGGPIVDLIILNPALVMGPGFGC
jgi:hypothetical protein